MENVFNIKKEELICLKNDLNLNIIAKQKIMNEYFREQTESRIGFNKPFLRLGGTTMTKNIGIMEYGSSQDETILITYGITTCCGIVITNANEKFLMHIDPTTDMKNLFDFLSGRNIPMNSKVLLVLGDKCALDYEKIRLFFCERNLDCEIHQLLNPGAIMVDSKVISIFDGGSNITRTVELIKPKLM